MDRSNIDYQNWNDSFKNAFLKECIDGFGAMNKNNYEVAIFNLLINNDFKGKSDFEISTILRIPESKVKRLRYEADLVYPKTDEVLKGELYNLLKGGSFKLTQERIQFSIPNKMLRLYLHDLLLQNNRFADGSYNSSIVSLTANDLNELLKAINLTEEDKHLLIKSIKEKLSDSQKELPKNAREKLASFGFSLIRTVGGTAFEEIVSQGIDELPQLLAKIEEVLNSSKK